MSTLLIVLLVAAVWAGTTALVYRGERKARERNQTERAERFSKLRSMGPVKKP